MAHPIVRQIAARLRGWQAPLLNRFLLQRGSHPMSLPRGSALIVAPHPDDESFACGGLIYLKRQAGLPVNIVFITDGRASQPLDAITVEQLIDLRKQEVMQATNLLGVPPTNLHFLDAPDGQLTTLSEVERNELVGRLRRVIQSEGAEEIYVPHRNDRHPDHEATYRLTLDAIEQSGARVSLFEYPVWILWRRPVPSFPVSDASGAGRIDLGDAQAVKDRAINVYGTQLPSMPPGFVPMFRGGAEYFFGPTLIEPKSPNLISDERRIAG